MSNDEEIIYEKHKRVQGAAFITINRPQRLNAFHEGTMTLMYNAFLDAADDKSIGVIVVTGIGDRAFSSGGDVRWEKDSRRELSRTPAPDLVQAMRMSPKPIVAAVKGYAIGGGNWLAYFADLTLAADNAVFGQNGARVGSPAGGYIVSYLARIVGEKKARELWYMCRRYSAHEALDMGLINWVVPLTEFDSALDEILVELLKKSPTVLHLLKASFDQATDYLRSWNAAFNQRMLAPDFPESDEATAGAQAFLDKREPDFRPLRPAPTGN